MGKLSLNMIEAALQQMRINDIKVVTQYEFEKVMTYHGLKGLDFDKVFLPYCNHVDNDTKQVDNDKKVFLVGMTCSRGDLINSFSKKLNRFVSKFAENCTHKDLATDCTPMLFDTPTKPLPKGRKVTTAELFGW